jgi:hypothetical protein
MATLARAMATAKKRVMVRVASAMATASKRLLTMAARAIAIATKQQQQGFQAMDRDNKKEGNGNSNKCGRQQRKHWQQRSQSQQHAIGLLAPSQRYNMIEGEEACRL